MYDYGETSSNFDPKSQFAQGLYARAMGGSPGAAQTQYRQQAGAAKQGLASQLAGSRSLAPGQAQHMQNVGQALISQKAASQAKELGMQEQLAGQDAWNNYMSNQEQYQQGMNTLANQTNMAQNEYDLAEALAKAQQAQTGAGAIAGGIGSALSILTKMSDRTAKKDIAELSDKDHKRFLEALTGYSYRYKQDAMPDDNRKHAGVMVQDLEKSEVGKRLVTSLEDASGKPRKGYDIKAAMGTALASLGHLNKRLEKIEKKGGK